MTQNDPQNGPKWSNTARKPRPIQFLILREYKIYFGAFNIFKFKELVLLNGNHLRQFRALVPPYQGKHREC